MRVFRQFLVADWLVIATLAIGGVVWAVRLEGRVNNNDTAIAAVDRRVDQVKSDQEKAVDEVRGDLRYIRMRLDQVLDAGGRSR